MPCFVPPVYRCAFTLVNSCPKKDAKLRTAVKTTITCWQLADPMGPYSFASPVCTGFACGLVEKQYTIYDSF